MRQSEQQTRRGRRLRSAQTGAESVLWSMLRGRQFENLKFRRQTPVAGFVVDFFCAKLRLVIELDGGVHDLRQTEDAARDAHLRQAGFTVLRFDNNAFATNPSIVLDAIRHRAGLSAPIAVVGPAPSSEPLRGPPSPPWGEGKETP